MNDKSCPKCGGSGKVPDPYEIGNALRILRKKARLSVREVARRMGIKAPYLSDLELGRRNWPEERIVQFKNAIKKKE